ncbi:hypothetical protein GWK41_07285 [Persephonella atlantica]|uniref:Uncharacterized protein n=1 Tax=Persephonella atlantica TaxID=2699429 RepID=A0ABS1GIV2_9AQUI|nr:hypothetical protein [Persephonella atlantica]MBK3332868.1 hypothetical protein [Persephonella atlantica]
MKTDKIKQIKKQADQWKEFANFVVGLFITGLSYAFVLDFFKYDIQDTDFLILLFFPLSWLFFLMFGFGKFPTILKISRRLKANLHMVYDKKRIENMKLYYSRPKKYIKLSEFLDELDIIDKQDIKEIKGFELYLTAFIVYLGFAVINSCREDILLTIEDFTPSSARVEYIFLAFYTIMYFFIYLVISLVLKVANIFKIPLLLNKIGVLYFRFWKMACLVSFIKHYKIDKIRKDIRNLRQEIEKI